MERRNSNVLLGISVLLYVFFYLSYALDDNFNGTIVNTLFKNIFILGVGSDSFPRQPIKGLLY